MEKEFGIADAWRKRNPNTIGTTWSNGVKDKTKRVRTRIDRVLTDKRILDRIIEIQTVSTKVSDHDAVMWVIETEIKRKTAPYNKISTDIIKDNKYKSIVREHFEKEKNNGSEGYERFKTKCVESAMKIKKKNKKKDRKDKDKIDKELEIMRKLQRWAESACIQEERGNKIKR